MRLNCNSGLDSKANRYILRYAKESVDSENLQSVRVIGIIPATRRSVYCACEMQNAQARTKYAQYNVAHDCN